MNQVGGTAPPSPKVIITGTGRAGTTLLVQVLTDLGLDTGFTSAAEGDPRVHGGLERDITDPDAPRIIKSPYLSWQLGDLIDSGRAAVDHVIIPIRDLDVAAASRVRSTRYGTNLRTRGGLFGTATATKQRDVLARFEYELFFTIARLDLPHTLLYFPRLAQDWEYTYRKLSFLDPSIPASRWQEAIEARYQPSWVHEKPLSGTERTLAVAGTVYHRGITRPIRGIRRVIGRTGDKGPGATP